MMMNLNYLKNRLFHDEGVEIWIQGRDYVVVAKDDIRYGRFYPIKDHSFEELFNVDPLLKRRLFGVKIKRDPNPLEENI